MDKHPKIILDFTNKVKLDPMDEKKLSKWLKIASSVLEESLISEKLTHASWLKGIDSIQVSIMLCGSARMKKINHEFRGKDYVTDVLSFPGQESLRTKKEPGMHFGQTLFLGDLVICHQKTIAQAREFNVSYFDEFIHLFFHGVVHLMGYDHEISPKEEKIMQKWEDLLLSKFSDKKKGR